MPLSTLVSAIRPTRSRLSLSGLGLALCLGITASAQAATRLDFSNEYNANSIHAQGDAYFIEQVTELTDGEVDITLHTGGALGFKSGDHFYAVADNAVQIADTLSGTMSGIDPIFLLSSLPFLVEGVDEARRLYEIARPHYDEVFEDNDQILLYASPWPASGIWSREAVTSSESLQNLKIRTFDRNGTETLRNAGAAPVSLSWADVVPQLATGGINAVLTSAEAGANASFWEHQQHFSGIQYAIPLNMVHMNRDAFESLSADQQEALREAARRTDEHNWQAVRERTVSNYATLDEQGVTIHDPISADFQQALADAASPVVSGWQDTMGERGQAILDAFHNGQTP
ncbi:C4-dicarboxylate ABC transporter [Litchfieldella qijiaojingensis]|uniref:C4-dicarboxylate ABC transporter n=1 Tax=Litchfieldella qijiaojingensis TaxID=980347 RepID=A0ABQ2ZAJ1_9GAMM|nr:TRAP transporter substrate-binding protein [Halomonas qijiaojingensis]GGY06353.1 C4-dicarboxylate ABC transporter [Halomonas qijiaojingensis]